jgi:hypothetical protein
MLRSTAEASLVSVVAEPSRDEGAGCGGANGVVSAARSIIRTPIRHVGVVKQFVAHLELELWEEPRDSFSKLGLQLLLQAPPRQVLMWALALALALALEQL